MKIPKIAVALKPSIEPGKKLRLLRKIFGLVLGVGLVASGPESRADVQAWNGNTNSNWSTASNWTAAFVPNTNSAIRIGVPASGTYPVVSQDAWCASLNVGLVNTEPSVWPTLKVTGGTLKATNVLVGGTASNGLIELSGGTLDFVNQTTLGGIHSSGTVYPGRIKVTGGTALLGVLRINPGSNIDVSHSGTVRVAKANTQIERIYDPLADGRITAWGGRGAPVAEYIGGTVVITAGPAPDLNAAYNPWPEDGAMNVGPQVTLDWSSGDDTAEEAVFFGTSPTPTQAIGDMTQQIDPDTDYYWQVRTTPTSGPVVYSPVWKFTSATPRSFWASQPVGAGKLALVHGVGFKNVRVQVAQLPAGVGTPNLAAAVHPKSSQPVLTDPATLAGLNWSDAEVVENSSTTIHFRIPGNFTAGVYAYKVTSRDENNQPTLTSLPYLLNAPQQIWVLGDRGKTATSGGTIRITGNAIGFAESGTPAIALVNSNNQIVRTIPASTKGMYSSQFAIPSDVPAGNDYRIFLSNGHGMAGGWQLCPTNDYDLSQAQLFSIQDAPVAGTYSGTITAVGANQDAAFTEALAAAANENGGTISFAEGTFNFTKGFTIPANTTIKGAGPTLSILNFSNGVKVGSSWFEMILRSNTTLQDLALNATGTGGSYVVSTVPSDNTITNVTISNVHTTQVPQPVGGTSNGAFSMRGTGIIIKDSQTTGSGIILRDVSHASLTGNIIRSPQGGISSGTVSNVVVENNQIFMNRDGTTENAGNNLTAYGAPSSQNFYFAQNTCGAAEGIDSVSDWTCDGGDGIYFGFASSSASGATTGTLTLAGPLMTHRNWPSRFGVFVVGGRGAGQWRRVLSHQTTSGTSTLTVDQPWDIAPDDTSVVTAVNVIGRITLYNNLFKNGSSYIVAYSATVDYLMDNNTIRLEDPSALGECQAGGGGHHKGLMPGWHYQLLNTQIKSKSSSETHTSRDSIFATFFRVAASMPRSWSLIAK